MSKKLSEESAIQSDGGAAVPFFVHLLNGQNDPAVTAAEGGPAPTYHCLDSECTKKYPSDQDDCYSYKPACDYG